jgi:hypothetical protein
MKQTVERASITPRRRFIDTLSFRRVDCIPQMDFGYWPETIRRWHGEGLPRNIDTDEEVELFLGLDRGFEQNLVNGFDGDGERGFIFRVFPKYPEITVEETLSDRIFYNRDGVLVRARRDGGSVPQFIKFPVESMADFDCLLDRLDPADPARIMPEWNARLHLLRESGQAVGIWLDGFFAWPRELMGLENLSIAMHLDPELVSAINRQHVQFMKQYVRRVLRDIPVDYACFFEDMAYKNGSMISPVHFCKYLKPCYEEVIGFLREEGIEKILVDSDGNTLELARLFVATGVDAHYPCEIAAGSTPLELRRRFARLALIGGVDKRALAAGKAEIDDALAGLKSLVRGGGFIPSVDHRVPPDVSLANYRYYLERKREMCAEMNT